MANNKPLISIVMPVYNAQRFLPRAVESILTQTFKDFELVAVDDASTDKSLEILKKYQNKDNRIRIIQNNSNLQIALSLNRGVGEARSDIIARMDADDISLPERLETQYKYLKSHPKVAIVGANIIVIDENEKQISTREYPEKTNELKKIMFKYSPFAHPVVMFKKKAFEEFGGYDVTKVPCEDIDLWFKLGSKYEFATVQEYVLKYTIVKNSNSNKKLKALELLGFRIKLNAIKKYGYKPGFYDALYNAAQFITLWFMPSTLRVWLYNFLRSNKII